MCGFVKAIYPWYTCGMKHTFHRLDSAVTTWIISVFGSRARPVFLGITTLGDPLAVGLVTAGIAAYGAYTSTTALVISAAMIPITVILGALLKVLFERARPMTEYALNMKLQTFSFPSGHSSGSMITYGMLAYFMLQLVATPWGGIACLVLAFVPIAVGISRVYLGAHFPTDVLAGWALGGLSLILVIAFAGPQL